MNPNKLLKNQITEISNNTLSKADITGID